MMLWQFVRVSGEPNFTRDAVYSDFVVLREIFTRGIHETLYFETRLLTFPLVVKLGSKALRV